MIRRVLVSIAGERREFLEDSLPLRIGGAADAQIRLPGQPGGDPIALLSLLDGVALLQPMSAGQELRINGDPVQTARRLSHDDVIDIGGVRIRCLMDDDAADFQVEYRDEEYLTAPPLPQGEGVTAERIASLETAAQVDPGVSRQRRALIGGSWALLGLLGILAWFIFTSKSVYLEAVPSSADISVGGSLMKMRIGDRYLLRPGDYQVTARAEGYHPLSLDLTVDQSPSQRTRLELRPLPGKLSVGTDPQVPGELLLNGEPAGQTPIEDLLLEAGSYDLSVVTDRYLVYADTVEIEGRNQRQELLLKLTPGWADVTVPTRPEGALIFIGDEQLGTGPGPVEVMAGSHELVIRKDGYRPWRQPLTAEAGADLELPMVELQEAGGMLTVFSQPTGGAVTIAGRYQGTTPADIELTPGVDHRVKITLPGHETVNRTVRVERASSRTLRVELKPILGTVLVTSDPPGAELRVGGRVLGKTPTELELPAAVQQLELALPGYEIWRTQVTPRPGLDQTVSAQLLTPQQAILAAIPEYVTTSQGAELKRVEPGKFQMGAPRREQGRRPNEVQRNIQLTRRFYIGVREVTNREFRAFRPNHTSGAEKYRTLAADKHPVVMLGWKDAALYCNWLSKQDGLPEAYIVKGDKLVLARPLNRGYRLPTEAEWVWAARYSGGQPGRKYPWGDRFPPQPESGNYADQSAQGLVDDVLTGYGDGAPVTAATGSFPASPLGLFDIGGNAAEWVNDYYVATPMQPGALETDPMGPETGQYHVIRGSGWRSASISELRLAYREPGAGPRLDVGFRIARFVEDVPEQVEGN